MQNSIGTITITTAEFISENPDGSINKRISQRSALATLISPRHVITVAHIFPPILSTEKLKPVLPNTDACNSDNQLLTGYIIFNDIKHTIKKYIPVSFTENTSPIKSTDNLAIVELESEVKNAPCANLYSAHSHETYEQASKKATWHGVSTFTHTVFPALKESDKKQLQKIEKLLMMPYHSVYGGKTINQFVLPLSGPDEYTSNLDSKRENSNYIKKVKTASSKYSYSKDHYPLFTINDIGAPIFWDQQLIAIVTDSNALPINEQGFSLSNYFWAHKTNAISLIDFNTGKRRGDLNTILSKIGCKNLNDSNSLPSEENIHPFTKNVNLNLRMNNTLVNKIKYIVKTETNELSTPLYHLRFTIYLPKPEQFESIETSLTKLYPNEKTLREKIKKALANKDLYVVQKKDTFFTLTADQSKMEFELFEEL